VEPEDILEDVVVKSLCWEEGIWKLLFEKEGSLLYTEGKFFERKEEGAFIKEGVTSEEGRTVNRFISKDDISYQLLANNKVIRKSQRGICITYLLDAPRMRDPI